MAAEYLQQLDALMRRATSGAFENVRLECKHFFGGAAIYANGRICMSLTSAGCALKLPERSRNTLLKRQDARPLRYFASGPIKKDYVVVPEAMLSDTKSLRRWVKACIEYALSLPLPTGKRGK